VEVFEPRHQLGFRLKPADEFGLIGVLREDDFDGDFASDDRLMRSIDRAKAACAEQLTQFIAANGLAVESDHRVAAQLNEDRHPASDKKLLFQKTLRVGLRKIICPAWNAGNRPIKNTKPAFAGFVG